MVLRVDFSYVFSTLKFGPKIRHFFLQFCLIILAKWLFLPLYKISSRIFSKTTSYQQNESVTQMLKKRARVIVTDIVLYCSLNTPHRHFSYYDKNMGSWQPAHAQREYHNNSTSGSSARVSYRTVFPETSARWSLLWAKFQIPVARQWAYTISNRSLSSTQFNL